MVDLAATIGRIKGVLDARRLTNEAAVKQAVVMPVLRALGWDDGDPDRVRPEYELSGRRVDLALSSFGDRPSVFIEVKAIGTALGAERQLFEYAYHEGIPFAVLTNGREWSFFLPTGAGSYDERLLYKLDLTERETAEAVNRLSRYLGFERVRSGEALKDANRDYDDLHKGRIVRDALPRAWRQLLVEPDEMIVELVADRTATLCGFRPSPDAVAAFLANGAASAPRHEPPADPPRRRRDPATATAPAAPTPDQAGESALAPSGEPEPTMAGGRLRYTLLGAERTARSGNEILLHVTRVLAGRDAGFMDRFAQEARTKRRNHVARTAEQVYPDKPQLLKHVVEVAAGWYIGTNVSSPEKIKLLKAACRAGHLSFGIDLVVSLPNT